MKVRIIGARGSVSKSGANYLKYGGATACIELIFKNNFKLLIDAGTGITKLEKELKNEDNFAILLSHYHKDHTDGLAFFAPFFRGGLDIYAPLAFGAKSADEIFERIFDGVEFPLPWSQIPKHNIHSFTAGASFKINDILIETMPSLHPGGCTAFRISDDECVFGFSGDHEIGFKADPKDDEIIKFLAPCDIAVVDSSYTKTEHKNCLGWGHSHCEQWLELSKSVKNLVLFHHSPNHDDKDLDKMLDKMTNLSKGAKIHMAKENMLLSKNGEIAGKKEQNSCFFCNFVEEISSFSDTHLVLTKILQIARKLSGADAGTLYLKEGSKLIFASAQNDTLFKGSQANRFFYLKSAINIDDSSLAGYCANRAKSLNIKDVYEIKNEPFSFNKSFDEKSGYRSKSMLLVPLINKDNEIMGVLQLINAKKNGKIVAFSKELEKTLKTLAKKATLPLQTALMTEELIIRMLKTSALRDPKETASHVWRVGSMAAEIYESWAIEKGLDPEQILSTKSKLRLAATLHDIGKVAIPDAVLKKPGKLDDDEMKIMRSHAYIGSKLFEGAKSQIDQIAHDIALHHHARWDGKGYSGSEDIKSPAGEDIPLFARITTIADVYDALVSRRVYKAPWDKKDALNELKNGAGSMFDPELVAHFEKVLPLIEAIFEKYQE